MTGKVKHDLSLTEEIAAILREWILQGRYRIGEQLKESVLCDTLSVSRTPVREALKLLAAEGIVEILPNRGAFARGFTKQDLRDLYAVRAAIEEMAIGLTVENITDEELARLEETYDLMEFYTAKKNSKMVLEQNHRFHEIIYHASKSRFMAQMLLSYQDYVYQARKATLSIPDNLRRVLSEHGEILSAIQARDRTRAMEQMTRHLRNAKERAEARWRTR